jgi:hypothetical protein
MRSPRRNIVIAIIGSLIAIVIAISSLAIFSPSKVEASPRAVIDTAEIACAREKNFESCVINVFEGFNTDWSIAAQELLTRSSRRTVSPYRTFCHTIAHDLGMRAGREGAKKMEPWSLRCEGGYIHGLMSVEFKDSDLETLFSDALTWCQNENSLGVTYKCAHLLGHELWDRAGGDMDLIEKCVKVTHPVLSSNVEQQKRLISLCRNGVYMEYFQSYENHQRWVEQGESAVTSELLAPCLKILSSSNRGDCLGVAYPALLLTSPSTDPIIKGEDGLARCSELEEADQNPCVMGVIAMTNINAPRGSEQALPLCDQVPAAKFACIRQIAIMFLTDAQDLPAAERMCASQENSDEIGCLKYVRDWYERNLLYNDSDGEGSLPFVSLP